MIDDSIYRLYALEECGQDGYPLDWHKCQGCEGLGWFSAATGAPHPQGRCRSPITTATGDTDGFHATCCDSLNGCADCHGAGSIKARVRMEAGHRCIRCKHPFEVGRSGVMEGPHAEAKGLAAEMGLSIEQLDMAIFDRPRLPPDLEERVLNNSPRTNWSDCDEHCTHGGPIRLRTVEGWTEVFGPDREAISAKGADALRAKGLKTQAAWRILTVHHLDEVKANCRWWNLTALCQRCHLLIQRKVEMDRPYPWDHTPWFQPYVAGFYAFKYRGEDLTRDEVMARLPELLDLGRQEEGVERMPL